MAQGSSDPKGDVRVGHRERDAVAAILQEAAGEGRLTLEELDERLGAALQATTYADLDPLVADLSVDLPWRTAGRSGPPRPTSAGYSREDPLRFGGVTREKRQGLWTVPPFIQINQGIGAKLNCLRATPAAEVIEIEVIGGVGSIVLVLPDGWAADTDRLSKFWGGKTVKVPQEPAPGKPLLAIYGSLGHGAFTVRPPSRLELRRVTRETARGQLGRG